ncbi:MAG: outer membrane protein transport protein [Acidobacteriota bacterium]
MRRLGLVLVSLFAAATGLQALTNEEFFANLTFNFNSPGARAVAMGGAFIGRADDATAAEANPAGLTTLLKPEISAEVKFLSVKNTVVYDSNNYTSLGSPIDRDFYDQYDSISFLSIVYPAENWALSFSRHEQVNIEQHYSTNGSIVPGSGGSRLFPVESEADITVSNYIGAVGFKVMDQVKVGGSLKLSRLNFQSSFRRFATSWFASSGWLQTSRIDQKEWGAGFNVGALVKPIEWVSVGAVYKRNPGFNVDETYVSDHPVAGVREFTYDVKFKVPDTFGVGVSIAPNDRLLMNLDVQRVMYSDLLQDFKVTVGSSRPEDFTIDDATEIHVGAEYVIPYGDSVIAVRGGLYTDPDHSMTYNGPNVADLLLFRGGDDVTHGTFGGGVVFSEHYQLDVAVDVSKTLKSFIISSVARF